jgi:transcriptional regulator
MYVPPPFRAHDREAILDLVDAYPFATLVTPDPAGVDVSHVPLQLVRADDGWGRLLGHVARANPHWQRFDGVRESVAIFQGPHAYVSPTWYASPGSPPTWNYAVAHAWGRPVRLDAERSRGVLDVLVARYESGAPLALPDPIRRSLERAIVAFELPIERVEAKFKLGQNKDACDRDGTVAALERDGGALERELAAWTRRITGAGDV